MTATHLLIQGLKCPFCYKTQCSCPENPELRHLARKFRKEKTGNIFSKDFQNAFNAHIESLIPSTLEEKETLRKNIEELKKASLRAQKKKEEEEIKRGELSW